MCDYAGGVNDDSGPSLDRRRSRRRVPDSGLALVDLITILAALEAIMGLFIEITFIATFTQRFFAR